MSVVLARVDDRLVHGQVLVGWGSALRPEEIVVCSDEIAASDWEKELLESSGTDSIRVRVLGTTEAASYLKELPEERRVFVLAEKPDCFLELVKLGLKIDSLNLGGMHYEDGKRRVTDYLYVDDHDVEVLRRLHELGIALQAQDVPGSRPVDVAKALGFA